MKEYCIDNKTKYIIYGAASIGIIVYNICCELKLPVEGFIDKRGDEISEFQGKRVWSINDEISELAENHIVIVAVKNVFEHDKIVKELLKKGFHNIIFRPYSVIKGEGTTEEILLYEIYEEFMKKHFSRMSIPQTFEISPYKYKDYATIEIQPSGERIVYVPIECLFTDKKEGIRNTWLDVPVMALIPHIDFFKWIDQQEGYSYKKYMDFMIASANTTGTIKITQRWRENAIKNRVDVYVNMTESMERDFNFFIRNAPVAKWNEEGHFNLVSGKHRATFWIAKGKRYIPLKISEADFQSWIKLPKITQLIDKIKKLDISKTHAMIEHPFFYNFPCDNGNFYFKLLCKFIHRISTIQYENMGYLNLGKIGMILISLNDDGYIWRCLQRYKMVVTVYNKSTLFESLEELLVGKSEVVDNISVEWAIIEYKYGTELEFNDLLQNGYPKNMICLVKETMYVEFEGKIVEKYKVFEKELLFKDGEETMIYWLEAV